MNINATLIVLLLCLNAGAAMGDVSVPAIIGNNMALQRNTKVPIWGWAEPGEKIKVTFAGQSVTGKANKDGEWKVYLNNLQTSAEPAQMKITAKNTITLSNILVGDVWLCAGQSNMEMGTMHAVNGEEECLRANYNQIRLLQMPKNRALTPQKDIAAKWNVCTKNNVSWFSAVGYFFGRDLYKRLNIPIGLIDNSIGGTRAEAWTSKEALAANPYLKFEVDNLQKAIEENNTSFNVATACYNQMCAPLIPFALKGTLWYQGESNAGLAGRYTDLMNTMMTDWRTRWENKDMPFLIVQLANFLAPPAEPEQSSWAELREAQYNLLKTKNTGLAVAIDIGEEKDIHPRNKQDVGYRLFLAARKVVYGENIVYSGPEYKSMTVEGNKIRIKFNHVGGGLVAKDGELKQFAVAGEDQKFHWATAVIEGDTVLVYNDSVTKPVAVRYAWANNPIGCNLYNKENLPAIPFRTDNWPGITPGLPEITK